MPFLPIVMLLIFGAPSLSAMTIPLWIAFGLNQVQTIGGVIKFINTPGFRKWAAGHPLPTPEQIQAAMAANGEYVIRVYPGNVN